MKEGDIMTMFRHKGIVLILSLLTIFMIAGPAWPAQISPQTAMVVATNYLTSHMVVHHRWNGSKSPHPADVQVVSYKGEPIGYLVSISPTGHILVAYYDDFSPVLFYSPSATLDPAKADDKNAIESWIIPEIYNHIQVINGKALAVSPSIRKVVSLDASIKAGSQSGAKISRAWQIMTAPPQSFNAASVKLALSSGTAGATSGTSTVGPLLQTQWNQGPYDNNYGPYNEYTPAETGCSDAPTGCVATAMAQTMKYWNWPDQGVGSHSYQWNGTSFTGPMLSANFAHPYNWANMPTALSTSTSTVQDDAVARLMSDVGIAVNMQYTCNGSGAYPSDAENSLVNFFKYSNTANLVSRSNYSTSNWMNLIVSELSAPTPRPILFSIQNTGGTEGHEVVIDGYQSVGGTDQVHINYGWGGYDDAYYDITSNWTAELIWSANIQELIVGIQPQSYTLTVNTTGGGTVTPNTGSLTWTGATGTGSYFGGTSVTLTATPPTGGTFTGWSGAGCSGIGTCVIPMNISQTVAAGFSGSGTGFTVTPSAGPGGSISPNTPQMVSSGTKLAFTVTPNTGNALSSVTGCNGALSGNTYTTLPITGNCTVAATFNVLNYTVTPGAGAGGSISPNTPQTVAYGTKKSFTLTPNSGYSIASVTGCNGTLSGNTYTTSAITGNCSVSATFNAITYTVIPSAGYGGIISPNTPQTVASGTKKSFTLTPNSGYGIASVTGCNGTLSGNTYTTSAITGNCIVLATFNPLTYTVTPSAGTGGLILPNTPQVLPYGTKWSFIVAPNSGYSIASVTGCNGSLSGNIYTTSAITGNCTVSAAFKAITYTVTPSAGAGGSISPNTAQTVAYGTKKSFTVTPTTGYGIASVTGCNGTLSGNTYTTSAITGNCSVSVAFKAITYTVTPSAGAGGSISPNTAQTVAYGTKKSFTVTPTTGYGIASVTGCNGTLSGNTFTTSAITGNCSIVTSFAKSTNNKKHADAQKL